MSTRRDDPIDVRLASDEPALDPVPRPEVALGVSDRARAWVEWFGVTRLVTSAVATVIVCVGAYWLIRTPPPPSEAALPQAVSGSPPVATLPTPTDTLRSPVAEPDVAQSVVVHVAGAVHMPGVYELSPSSRVSDAVVAAGGPTPEADLDRLNLAAVAVEGSRIYVPVVGEEPPPVPVNAADGGVSEPAGPVDVNRASAEQLESLPGVGPATAQAIVTERDRNGPFVSVADLDRVPGIGPAKLGALDGLVVT